MLTHDNYAMVPYLASTLNLTQWFGASVTAIGTDKLTPLNMRRSGGREWSG